MLDNFLLPCLGSPRKAGLSRSEPKNSLRKAGLSRSEPKVFRWHPRKAGLSRSEPKVFLQPYLQSRPVPL